MRQSWSAHSASASDYGDAEHGASIIEGVRAGSSVADLARKDCFAGIAGRYCFASWQSC